MYVFLVNALLEEGDGYETIEVCLSLECAMEFVDALRANGNETSNGDTCMDYRIGQWEPLEAYTAGNSGYHGYVNTWYPNKGGGWFEDGGRVLKKI